MPLADFSGPRNDNARLQGLLLIRSGAFATLPFLATAAAFISRFVFQKDLCDGKVPVTSEVLRELSRLALRQTFGAASPTTSIGAATTTRIPGRLSA